MDLLKIISDIEKVDPEIYDRLDPRRRVFKHFGVAGKALATAAVPGIVASIFNKAYGQTGTLPADIAAVLNFALKLEYLESFFYQKGLGTAGLIPAGAANTALTLISRDETNHVTTLRGALGTQAIAPLTTAAFDYTGAQNGKQAALFPTVFSDYATFLTVAQAFEDTGVRAYKGGAAALMANKAILTVALQIHSVEARHASHLRTMRRNLASATGTTPKSWIADGESIVVKGAVAGGGDIYGPGSPATSTTPAAASKYFPSESNTSQGGVELKTALSALNLPASSFAESFDEPLDSATVAAVAVNFIVSGTF